MGLGLRRIRDALKAAWILALTRLYDYLHRLQKGNVGYTLDGHEAELDKLAGERATVKGSVMGEMVMVESVAAAKKTAK